MEEQFGGIKEKTIDPRLRATAEQLRDEAKPAATRFLKQISLYANNKYSNGAQMTAVIALGIVERVLLNIAKNVGTTGSEEGKKFIESVYDAAKKDALSVWGKT